MGCHVCIKLNPTLLGQDEVAHLLHDVLGYREIQLHPPAFENDLQFDEAIDLIPRLQQLARRHGREPLAEVHATRWSSRTTSRFSATN